jgi:GMP synthase-like glutamine amidotransferase
MRIHCLTHVPFEGPGFVGRWAEERGHRMAFTRLYAGDLLPAAADLDLLLVMGGPMNIYEHDPYPWLAAEKACIRAAIDAGKKALGICLGAQLVADVLGGPVTRNPLKEIGWFEVARTNGAAASRVFSALPERFMALHWHGDTFAVPPGCLHAAASRACANQAFVFEDRVVGLQFHLEATAESLAALIENCADELVPGPWIESAEKLSSRPELIARTNGYMRALLEAVERA